MIICTIKIQEVLNNQIVVNMEPDNRDGSQKELAIARELDEGLREVFTRILKPFCDGKMIEGEAADKIAKEFGL